MILRARILGSRLRKSQNLSEFFCPEIIGPKGLTTNDVTVGPSVNSQSATLELKVGKFKASSPLFRFYFRDTVALFQKTGQDGSVTAFGLLHGIR